LANVITGQKFAQQFDKDMNRVWQAPIIITCDSGDLSSFTTVARVCQVVEFIPPTNKELINFFESVCDKENLNVGPEVQRKVVEGCGGDVRRLLNTLHFLAINGDISQSAIEATDVTTIFYDQHR